MANEDQTREGFEDLPVEPVSLTALQSSQRLSEVALASGAFGSWSLQVSTQVATRSFRHDQIFGYSQPAPNWTYELFISFVDPRDRVYVDTAYRRALETGRDWEFEARITRLDGEERWIWAKGKHFRDESGKPVEIVGLVSDITDRKRSELAMRQNEKMAAVGRLASTVAHEINNPLEAVTNLLYLARTSEDPAVIRDYLITAEAELQRVSAITNQTLKFQRTTSVAARVDIRDLMAGVLSIFKGRIINHGLTVSERHGTEQSVLCFDGEIRQVLNNLVSNAIDASKPGGQLILRSRSVTNPLTNERGVVLTVADTGSGMSPEIAKKIYDPFFSTKGSSGSGLGLWVSLEVVRRHHGRLSMRSSQSGTHHGTVFSLYLPTNLVPDEPIYS